MKALLTGSRAYGTPRTDSDVDVVLRVTQAELDALLSAIPAENVRKYPENDSVSLWFNKLNLICITSDKYFQIWEDGTAALMAKAPVTRDEAIAEFNSRGVTKSLESQERYTVVKEAQTKQEAESFPF